MELVFSQMIQIFPRELSKSLTADWAYHVILEWLSPGWDGLAKLMGLQNRVQRLSRNIFDVGFDECKMEILCQKISMKIYYASILNKVFDGRERISYSN